MARETWVNDANAALFTDLYQLTMLQAYFEEGLDEEAVFDLFVRRLRHRNYLLACGLDTALHYLERLRFTPESLAYLATLGLFSDAFLAYLADFRFTGDVHAVPEGTPVFANAPILQVVAPLGQAQLVETFLLNQITFQTGIASKAVRVRRAARGRAVVDFGMRRMHGADAALKAARAYYVAGITTTSNVLAGQVYGLDVTGTMAHSYIEAHEREQEAFQAFAGLYPGTTLLVDTYDTLEGVRRVIRMAEDQGDAFQVAALRLDSGDLATLSREARALLDDAGLTSVRLFASGGLDEYTITALVEQEAPLDGFGVGTRMGALADQPYLDSVYKLSAYAGRPRMKLSTDKASLPGRKQVFRFYENGRAVRDVIARAGETLGGEALLVPVMSAGRRTEAGTRSLDEARRHAEASIEALPPNLLALTPADPPYAVELSPALEALRNEVRAELQERASV